MESASIPMPIRSSDWNISNACCLVRDMASYPIILTEQRPLRQIRGMIQNCGDAAGYVLPADGRRRCNQSLYGRAGTLEDFFQRKYWINVSTPPRTARPIRMVRAGL